MAEIATKTISLKKTYPIKKMGTSGLREKQEVYNSHQFLEQFTGGIAAYFLELKKDYADKNIEIISISVDRDKQAWIDMITEDKPGWLQLHDGVNLNDEYLVKYIPTFVLIDRDGKILNPRAPRPSSGEELTNLFDSLEGI